MFEADEAVFYVGFVTEVDSGDLQVEAQGTLPAGRAHLGAPSHNWALCALKRGGDIQGGGRRKLHHVVELHTGREEGHV